MGRLTYFKCLDCLAAFTSTEAKVDVCACGGKVECMGKVFGASFVRTEERCACDKRCTHAAGPSCDCACGGVNHGTGKMVEVVLESGKLVAKGANLKVAEEWRAMKAEVDAAFQKRWGGVDEAKAAGEFVSRELWDGWFRARKAMAAAKSGKVHKTRMANAVRFVETMSKAG